MEKLKRRRVNHFIRSKSKSTKYPVYAAIDLGTNNCRLMVARESTQGNCCFVIMDSYSHITRLGEGVVSNHILGEKAKARTMKVLSILAERMKKYQIIDARCVVTEVCRKADDGEQFVQEIREKFGLDFEIIPASEEARLAITGCLPLVEKGVKYLLAFDIGGGSSEVALVENSEGNKAKIIGSISIPMGVLTVSEGFTGIDLSGRARETITDKVNAALQDFDNCYGISELLKTGKVQMIGTSGTVTSLGAFHLGLTRYNRNAVDGLVISAEDVHKARSMLESMSNLERITHPCIGPQRADLTLAGCAILGAIFDFWKVDSLTIADRGLREGMIIDLMHKNKKENLRIVV